MSTISAGRSAIAGVSRASQPGVVPYPPIADYAAIGDCRTAALVSRAGSIDWLCLPHFSAPSIFGALLDREHGGSFSIAPAEPATAARRYAGDTNVLESTWRTITGTARVTDLVVTSEGSRLQPLREILRIIDGIQGTLELEVHLDPRPDYGRTEPLLRARGDGQWSWSWGNELLLLQMDSALQPEGNNALGGRIRLNAGQRYYLSLGYTKADIAVIPALGQHAEARLRSTLDWWQHWSARCTYQGPHRDAVVRSALVLKLMTYAISGAVIAAPTTSLPELIGGHRNWDYRYCWLRDAALTMRAFTGLGYMAEAQAFLDWMLHATRLTWPELQVLYDEYGRPDIEESEHESWEGYRESRPVRIGNGARGQRQLDVYGAVVHAAHTFVEHGATLQRDEARLLAGLGRAVCKLWREPDHGIWEIRCEPRHYTFSKVMCWTALDGLLKLHDQGVVKVPVDDFRREREAIRDAVEHHGFNRALGSYVGVFDGAAPDASLLLLGCLGYRDPADSRMRGLMISC